VRAGLLSGGKITNRKVIIPTAARVEKLERGHDRTASVIEVLIEDTPS
jgi:hypothetical protein